LREKKRTEKENEIKKRAELRALERAARAELRLAKEDKLMKLNEQQPQPLCAQEVPTQAE